MINSVILTGRACSDANPARTTGSTTVTDFTLAVERSYAKQGEEKKTDFIRCTAFGKTAEIAEKYIVKGGTYGVSGRIQVDKYTDRDGVNRENFKVIVDSIHFFGEKRKQEQKQDDPSLDGYDLYNDESYYPAELPY